MTNLVKMPDETAISSNGHSEKPQQSATIARTVPRNIFEMSAEHLQRLKLLAQMYASSSFNSAKQPKPEGDYFLIMMKGLELGISPMTAVDFINIIQGQPCIDGKGMLALISNSGELENIAFNSTDQHCTVTIKRKGRDAHSETWTMDDARKFKTWEKGKLISLSEKHNWQSQPKTMLKWRALAACARVTFSDVIGGLYTKEEIGSEVVVYDDGTMQIETENAPQLPAKQQSQPDRPAPESTQGWWQDSDKLQSIAGFAHRNGYTEKPAIQEVLDLLGLKQASDLQRYPDGKACGAAIQETAKSLSSTDKAEAETVAVTTKARYNSKYISFPDVAGTPRWYAGRTQLIEQVGEAFAKKYNVAKWDTDEDGKAQTFTFADDPLYVRHELAKSGKYNQVVEIKLAPTEAEHQASETNDFDDIDGYFDEDQPPPADEEAPEPPNTYEDVPF